MPSASSGRKMSDYELLERASKAVKRIVEDLLSKRPSNAYTAVYAGRYENVWRALLDLHGAEIASRLGASIGGVCWARRGSIECDAGGGRRIRVRPVGRTLSGTLMLEIELEGRRAAYRNTVSLKAVPGKEDATPQARAIAEVLSRKRRYSLGKDAWIERGLDRLAEILDSMHAILLLEAAAPGNIDEELERLAKLLRRALQTLRLALEDGETRIRVSLSTDPLLAQFIPSIMSRFVSIGGGAIARIAVDGVGEALFDVGVEIESSLGFLSRGTAGNLVFLFYLWDDRGAAKIVTVPLEALKD